MLAILAVNEYKIETNDSAGQGSLALFCNVQADSST